MLHEDNTTIKIRLFALEKVPSLSGDVFLNICFETKSPCLTKGNINISVGIGEKMDLEYI